MKRKTTKRRKKKGKVKDMNKVMVGNVKKAVSLLGLLAVLTVAASVNAAKQPPQTPVDVNKASVEELKTIPGLGASKAQAIVAYREQTPFATTNELVNVKGIGDKLYAKIAPYVTVSGQPQGLAKTGTAEKTTR